MRSYIIFRMDDPILWGILPLSYMFSPQNHRWGLGSYDLCFTNKYANLPLLSAPTNRLLEGCRRFLRWDRFYRPIAPRTRHSAVSFSPPSRKRFASSREVPSYSRTTRPRRRSPRPRALISSIHSAADTSRSLPMAMTHSQRHLHIQTGGMLGYTSFLRV